MNLLKNLVKLLFWLAGLAVIAAAAAVILVSTIDPNEHKDWITARIQDETGRSITLDGPLAITLYPWLGVEAQQVSVANAEGFGAEPLAYLDYVKLRVRTLPLLREEYEVDTIAVKGAVLNLARNGQGSANWDDLDGVDEAAGAAGDEALLPLAAVALGGVAIEDARIVLDDQQDGVRYEVSGLDVSTAELKYGEPVDVNLNFRGSSNKPALEAVVALAGNITYATDGQQFAIAPLDINAEIEGGNIPGGRTSARLSATLDVNLDEETLVLDRFTLEGLGLETSGNVEVNDIFADPAASGELEVLPFNLRRLARQLKQELPATQGDDTFTRVSLAGRFDRTAHGLNLDQLELQLDDTRLTGEFMLDNEASGPVVQFDLDIDQIDLDRYLPPASTKAGRLAAVPVVAAAYADMDGDVNIDRLIVADARLDGFRLHLKARNGVVQAEPLAAALYEGRLSADISLDTNPTVPVLTLNANLADIQAEPLLMDVKGKARLRGRGNFSAALTAEGASIAAMKRSLEGALSLTFTEGAIAGFNLGRALRQWKQFSKGRIVNLEETAATDFTEFSGNPVARNGIIRMDDLVLKAPAFRLQGAGVLANLHTDTIDYQAVATVVNTAKGAGAKELADLEGLQLPLKVEGALDDPKIRLAWEDILSGLLIEKVLDVLDLPLPGREQPEASETDTETEEESDFDPVKELLKEGLKEGLKGIFKKN
ncbi:MAG: AsmA family protein [Gammaproteobacteria bacterium]|nr:AsmA family protein [Gammaproteobacteria bacterium]